MKRKKTELTIYITTEDSYKNSGLGIQMDISDYETKTIVIFLDSINFYYEEDFYGEPVMAVNAGGEACLMVLITKQELEEILDK